MKDEAKTTPVDLRSRTKQYALRIIRLFSALPATPVAQVLGKQLLRSGTSIGAHYREAFRSRSDADFVSKMECGLQELDESAYWIDLIVETEMLSKTRLTQLRTETDELIAIFTTCVKRTKARRRA